MGEPRKFKCRNGAVIVERHNHNQIEDGNGFIDDYVIEKKPRKNKEYKNRSNITLVVFTGNYPTGGAHGSGWDITEEVTP